MVLGNNKTMKMVQNSFDIWRILDFLYLVGVGRQFIHVPRWVVVRGC